MRTRQLALTGAAITLIASLGGAASPARAAPSCSSGSTLAISKSARVFQVKDGSIRRLYGCSTSTQKRSYLGRIGSEGVDTSVIAVTGPRVAYVRNSCGEAAPCGQSVLIRDLKKRETLRSVAAAPGDGQKVTDIVLSKGGTVAWISHETPAPTTARYVLTTKKGQGVVLLGFGLNIVPGSLALVGNTLYWLQPRAVLVRIP